LLGCVFSKKCFSSITIVIWPVCCALLLITGLGTVPGCLSCHQLLNDLAYLENDPKTALRYAKWLQNQRRGIREKSKVEF
jgi:hypothetical protein